MSEPAVDQPVAEPIVTDAPERSRFELTVAGEPAGFAEYRLGTGRITFVHTVIGEEFGGRGLGGVLVRAALDSARERGLAVVPVCPFVRGWLAKHPEYVDLVPEGQRARFELA